MLTQCAQSCYRYKFLAERCWAEMVELRPSLEVVMNELENLQKNLCPQVGVRRIVWDGRKVQELFPQVGRRLWEGGSCRELDVGL